MQRSEWKYSSQVYAEVRSLRSRFKMSLVFKILCSALIFTTVAAAPRKQYGRMRANSCPPQGTPKYGSKWCEFTDHQAEIGSICHFSCMQGYHLRGPRATQCISDPVTGSPMYNDSIGFCEPNAPILKEGQNGPYLVHSYAPSAYVIHVTEGKEVTLKSYYYLALYVQTPGLNGVENTISFLVQGEEGRYIKANGTHVYTDNVGLETDMERDRATFWLRNDRYFDGYAAFESYGKKGYYMVHRSRKIHLSRVESDEDKILASYIWSPDL